MREAFGRPGIAPNWASARKHGVGTAIGASSRVWFTIADGVVTEVYYPSIDIANSRDLKFLITDGKTFFDEEGVDTVPEVIYIDRKAPAYLIRNTSRRGDYRITKRIVTDPEADSLVMNVRFDALKMTSADYRLHLQFAPHIKNRGYENSGRCASYNGRTYLIAWREDICSVVTSSHPFIKMSAGYSGVSDGWHDLKDNLLMDWEFDRAEGGNIALTAEVSPFREFEIVLSFGRDDVEAVLESEKTLKRPFRAIERGYVRGWRDYMKGLANLGALSPDRGKRFRASAIVLKTHEDKTRRGGVIASLSVPWGERKGDREASGYHLVWPRDLVKAAFAFMAMDDMETAMNTLRFLRETQNPDGSWPQNMWINGAPHLTSVQLDEVALPVMLAWRLRGMGASVDDFYPMVKSAASYIVKHGPVTDQERWEENTGFSPSTLAAEISALVCAAEWAGKAGDAADSGFLFSIADYWAARVEDWTFSECDCIGKDIPGHYLRIVEKAPESLEPDEQLCHALVFIKNYPEEAPHHQGELVDAGFLELVRFGVRDPKAEPILSSIVAVDEIIRFESGDGPAFYRYNGDGYGEKADGSPFDGAGVGRPWPLITGERAMYEILAGGDPKPYIRALEAFANDGLMLPEQVWDKDDIPEKRLFRGRGTGAATPLLWAHAEYIKVLRTVKDGKGCDMIGEVKRRYVDEKKSLKMTAWKKNRPIHLAKRSDIIRVISFEKGDLVWTADEWGTKREDPMGETGLGVYYLDFPPDFFDSGTRLIFTFHYADAGRWEGVNYEFRIY